MSVSMPQRKKDPLLPFVAMWPSIWIWIQTLLACAQLTCPQHVWLDLKLETRQMRYDAAFGALEFLTRPTSPTCSAANIMPGVMSTSAALWIAEGRDPSYTFGFQAAWLMRLPPDSEQNVHYPPNVLKHIADRDLDHDAIISVMIFRIKGNLLQKQPEPSSLVKDLLLLCVQVKADETATELSRNMRRSFLFRSTCAVDIANILSLIVDKYTQIHTLFGQLLDPCLNIALILVEDKFAFHRISQLLDSSFFNLLARADGLLGPPKPYLLGPREVIERLVPTFLTRLSTYRSMFTRMRTEVLPTRRQYKNPNGQLRALFSTFETKLSSWEKEEREYKTCPFIVRSCGNSQCRLIDRGYTFRRCSGCNLVTYCDVACQKLHWRSGHKELCGDMSRGRQDAVGLSAPDLRFLAFLITKSVLSITYEDRLSVVRNSVGHIIGTRFPANSNPVVALDYDCPEWPGFRIVDLNDEARMLSFSQLNNIPDIRDVWWQGWSFQADNPVEDAKFHQIPVLALVPRTWETPQTMALVVTIRGTVDEYRDIHVKSRDVEHRWIYYK
ncbi:hypothetical protein FIBSPDRAFT_1044259 [Athelia psychrophila]|uniref:MYND-type domain-containing protein n=1 Tax=Athelia psychrophila TaxID=1759441 RepID=A0A166JXE3_9AGAM|nr:hypothetical protein FIBSPDRAFT_1044259 [Fibularhizoctonia sp. CBS 109695]